MDSVLLYWNDMLVMVAPQAEPVQYFYDEPLVLIPECDGVRILSNSSMEFLQRVPASTEQIFAIGSTSPAALLHDALDHFDRRSAKVVWSSFPVPLHLCEIIICSIHWYICSNCIIFAHFFGHWVFMNNLLLNI